MRLARLFLELLLVGALLLAVLLLYIDGTRGRLPILPHFVFEVSGGSLVVQGTWRREDGDDAWPTQTTTIECERSSRRCREASAVLADNEQLMPIVINDLSVVRWDEDLLVVQGPGAACISEIYSFRFSTKSVTGLVTRKDTEMCRTAPSASPGGTAVRTVMVDGYKASMAAGYGRPLSSGSASKPDRRGSLHQAGFLVEFLGAGMQRDAEAEERRLLADRLALGVAGIERGARLVAPQRLGDLVDEVGVDLGRCHPLRADRQRLDAATSL